MFCTPRLFSTVPRASVIVFMFCTPESDLGCTKGAESSFHALRSRSRYRFTEGVGSSIHVLHSLTRFRRYLGRRVQFSCSMLPDPFSTVLGRWVLFTCFALPDPISVAPRASFPVLMVCASRAVFDVADSVGSSYHVLRSRTRFRRCRVRQVQFSCFALPYSFSTVSRASGPVFIFCAPRPDLDGTEGVTSSFMFYAP
jgi:hypothetical protein